MEQRSLRLGDIVDDYCPRERRITNHSIVAIVEDAIRQTRCTTCDYEHVFKQAREPRRRTKPAESLYEQVLADVAGGQADVAGGQLVAPPAVDEGPAPAVVEAASMPGEPAADDPVEASALDESVPDEGWAAHRTLIRATLPKTDGEPPPARPIPEFTMHQKPQSVRGRGAHRHQAFGPQGDPFGGMRDGRPGRANHGPGRGNGDGNGNGNGNAPGGSGHSNGNGPEPGQRRGRRRRGGKRAR